MSLSASRTLQEHERTLRSALGLPAPLLILTLLCAPASALAQRVDENATAQAEDAFGINISGQNLGLYDPSNVRGFSPTAAGNIRLDGLYFDAQSNLTSRLVGGYRILVGPSVLGHPFPAPSGIVDYALRRPGKRDVVSVSAYADSFGGLLTEIDGQLHDVLPDLGFTGGVGLYHHRYGRGGGDDTFSSAVTGMWTPGSGIELVPFFSRIGTHNLVNEPIIVLAGPALPPPLRSRQSFGQQWTRSRNISFNYGGLARIDHGSWRLRAALFRSQQTSPIAFTPLFLETQSSGTGHEAIIAERGRFAGATSADLQLSRTFGEGPRRHLVSLAIWGRDQRRRYGATDEAALPAGRIDLPQPVPRSDFQFGPQTRDRVRQVTLGLAYEGQWKGVGSLNLGVQKTDYRKTVVTPDTVLPTSRDQPWLFNASAALDLTKKVAAYAGLSRGLEESDVAPAVAVNRNQAPPAIRTRQIDAGLHWAVAPRLSLIADVFEIEKPYYGLDSSRLFRSLGTIRHRGVELSLAGSPLPGMNLVLGAVGLDAEVSGEQVDSGLVGKRPTGWSPTTFLASLDYRLPAFPALSFDANVNRDGPRTATVDDRLRLPSRTVIDLGLRYRFPLDGSPAVLRLQVTNLFDSFSWDIAGSGALQPRTPRQVVARLTIDR